MAPTTPAMVPAAVIMHCMHIAFAPQCKGTP